MRHNEFRILAKDYKKKSLAIKNNDINNKEITVSIKLVGAMWCDIHKEWYMRA